MWQVLGRSLRELPAGEVAELVRAHATVVVDVGTGDGKHVLAEARARPGDLVVGLDPEVNRMRAAAARAAAKPARGGLANALFVRASVQQWPAELTGVGEVHVLMPWGSLLRALMAPDAQVLAAVARACRPGARFLVTLNLHAWRPPVPEVGATPEPTPESVLTELAPGWAAAGWAVEDAAYLDAAGIAALATSWTKRLGSSRADLAVLAVRGTIGPAPAEDEHRTDE